MNFKLTLVAIFIVIFLTGCGQQTSGLEHPMLQYVSELYLESNGELVAELCVVNSRHQDFPETEEFLGVMAITTRGTLRAKSEIYQLPQIPAGEAYCPLRWSGYITPGLHQLTWGENDSKQTAIEFEIGRDQSLIILKSVE